MPLRHVPLPQREPKRPRRRSIRGAMSAASGRSRRAHGARLQAVISLLTGAGLLIGGGAALSPFIPNAWQLARYETAPTCSAMSEAISGADCRASGSARVLALSDAGSVRLQLAGSTSLEVTAQLPAHTFVESSPGDTVPVEVWAGKVTAVDGVSTADNPSGTSTIATIGVLLALLGVGVIVWGVRAWRRPEDDLEAPSLAPISTGGTLFNQ